MPLPHAASGPTFDDVMALSRGNKRAYAQRHGYALIDASVLRNFSRPASWSKILAVRSHLARFDWVFWVDADTMVTNPAAQLEALLPAASTADLVITKDAADYNAGAWPPEIISFALGWFEKNVRPGAVPRRHLGRCVLVSRSVGLQAADCSSLAV